jgi:hypothetical protein
VKSAVTIKDLKNMKSYGVQSLDIFACDKTTVNGTGTVKILSGIRSGDVIECLIDYNRDFQSSNEIMNDKNLTQE